MKITYGAFDYYTGGDLNSYAEWGGVDMETPVAKATGEVDVMTLNHHGYYDASNAFFLNKLSPKVVVHQIIHDPHYQLDVLNRISEHDVDIFTYNMHDSTKIKLPENVKRLYKSTDGHVLIRALPGGAVFEVYSLYHKDMDTLIGRKYGSYISD